MPKREFELDASAGIAEVAACKSKPGDPYKDDGAASIDGDKVIAFVSAVQNLGVILEKLNIIAVKDAFLFGIQTKGIDAIIEQEKTWKGALEQIGDSLKQSGKIVESARQDWKLLHHEIMPLAKFFGGSEFKESLKNVAAFCDLCERLERHRANGTLDLITKL